MSRSKIFLFFSSFLLLSVISLAHEGSFLEKEAEGYTFGVSLTPENPVAGEDTEISVIITDSTGNPVTGLDVIYNIRPSSIILSAVEEEDEPGEYAAAYAFPNALEYSLTVSFEKDSKTISQNFEFEVENKEVSFDLPWILVSIVGGVAIFIYSMLKKGKKKAKKTIKASKAVVLSLVYVGGVVLVFSVIAFYTTGAAKEGVLVCNPNNPKECLWQTHIHTYIKTEVCGEVRRFPIEVGSLDGPHTHEEKNTMHWHASVPYDVENQRVKDETPFKIGTSMDSVDAKLTDTCLYEYCNGDLCPDGKPGTLKAFMNTENYWDKNSEWQQLTNPREYIWKDRDIVVLVFDSRTSDQLLQDLTSERIIFPGIGAG